MHKLGVRLEVTAHGIGREEMRLSATELQRSAIDRNELLVAREITLKTMVATCRLI